MLGLPEILLQTISKLVITQPVTVSLCLFLSHCLTLSPVLVLVAVMGSLELKTSRSLMLIL